MAAPMTAATGQRPTGTPGPIGDDCAAADGPVRHSRPWITQDDIDAVSRVMATGMLAAGAVTRQFEQRIAARCNLAAARFVASGRIALVKALQLVDVGSDDEVLIPTYVCHSVRDAVRSLGAVPILCDVGPDWCLDPEDVEKRMTPRTRCIVVAHMFGIAADVDSLLTFGVPVIEDCAQSFGGRTADGRQLGTIGAAAIFSLQPTKPLTAGTGGILGSADARLASGLCRQDHDSFFDTAAPLTDIHAALGLSQVMRYDAALRRRRFLAERYLREMSDIDAELPGGVSDRSMYFRFPLRVRRSVDELMAAFAAHGVLARRGVDTLLHRVAGIAPAEFPGAEACFETTLSLPIYPALTDQEATRVIAAARHALRARL